MTKDDIWHVAMIAFASVVAFFALYFMMLLLDGGVP